jgi:hypothetical protein
MQQITVLNTQKLLAAANGGRGITELGLYRQGAKVTLAAKSDAGTSPTLAVKLQNAPEQSRLPEVVGAGDDAIAHRTGTDTAISIGAAFTLAAARTIAAVVLPLAKNGTVSSGTLTLAIQADSDGDPSGSDLVTSTSAAADVSADGSNVEFRFANPHDLAAGDYWLVLTSDVTLSATNNIEWRSTAVESGGNAAVFDEAWAAEPTHDLEHWCESYQFADISGAAFTAVAATGVIETIEVNADALAFVRPHITIGGTNTPAFYLAISALANPD